MKTVLVVEDSEVLGETLVRKLTSVGYRVPWARDSEAAFGILNSQPVDLIYLDIMLPGGSDGYEILRRLKQLGSKYQHIPVIMLTNLGQIKQMDRAMEIGADDYLIKANIQLDRLVELTKQKLG